jgi:hypothetical protein
MAKDYGEKEREFIAGLKNDTGKDLAEWMAAIAAQGFTDKNDAIDWLRTQGFLFNDASWLERIHANGGRLIYGDRPAAASPPRRTASNASAPKPAPRPPEAPSPPPKAPPPVDERLQALIAGAKGYQPLYRLLTSEILRALPGAQIVSAETYVSIGDPREFAAIETSPKGLRLALDLGDRPFTPPLQPSKLAAPPKRLSHMIVLDDARQVDGALMALVKTASARVNA